MGTHAREIVAKVDELKDGQMKSVEIDGRVVLLVRLKGEFFACSGTCPHHGAPLAEGSLRDGHVRCPWHQAVFDARTGELLEPPALDGLEPYEVVIEGDDVCVILPEEAAPPAPVKAAKVQPTGEGKTFVILGAGAAAISAAQTLRARGFAGKLRMITREAHPPYDRTELTKGYLRKKAEAPFLRTDEFYRKLGVEILRGRSAAEVDLSARKIHFEDAEAVSYDRLLLATGASPRKLGVEGEDLEGVLTLRTLDDCEKLRSAVAPKRNVVVVGASFIGMEVGAALAKRKMHVTVASMEAAPFDRVLGARIGGMYRAVHEDKGITFKLGRKIKRFVGGAALEAVELDDGERLAADLAVVGAGVRPETGFLSGIALNDDGGVPVDEQLRAAENVWAAGDIASFPDWRTGEPIRIEHWRVAQQHGRVAAVNMLDGKVPFRGVPFFWTEQFLVITDYVGYCRQWDEIVFDGDLGGRTFLACYVKDGRVMAVAACGAERRSCIAGELLESPEPPRLEDFQADVARRLAEH